jgi:hypothetical protein
METPFELRIVDGSQIASNGKVSTTLIGEGKQFRRRAVKLNQGTGERVQVEWSVTELNGVRVYQDNDGHVVVTTEDLWP